MASQRPRTNMTTFKGAVDAELTCAVCLHIINYPKVLPCLHTFCRDCLEGVIAAKGGSKFPCPICKADTTVPEKGVDGFPTNFTIQNIIEARAVAESEEGFGVTCENGLDDNKGVARCIDCSCYLCETCVEQHKKLRATRNHRIVSLVDIRNDARSLEYKRICIDHEEEELKLFCQDCQEAICRDCTIVNHKGHNYEFIKKIHTHLCDDIKKLLDSQLERKCQEFADHLQYLGKVKMDSDENIEICKTQVYEYFNEYHRRLEAHKDHLINELAIAQGDRSKQLDMQQEVVETSNAKLLSAKEFATQLLNSGIPVDIALMYKQTMSRLKTLKDESWDRNSAQPSRWVFIRDETQDDPFKAKVRGGISRNDLRVEGLGQPVPGVNKFRVFLETEVDTARSNLVVTFVNENGEQLPNIDIKCIDRTHWEVTYIITEDGSYVISVLLDGVEANESPFVRQWKYKLEHGMKVRRGNDWKWGDQDSGAEGTVMGWSEEVGASNNWAKIKWETSSRQNNYRWGAEGAYDLMIVPRTS